MSEAEPSLLDATVEESPTQEVAGTFSHNDLEFAERIIRRLRPSSQQDLYDKAAKSSKIGGMVLTVMVVVWWFGVHSQSEEMALAPSEFFGLDFGQAALAVMGLSLCSAILAEFSRDMGKIIPSSLAGGMLILAGLYVIEPLVAAMFGSTDLTSAEGMWRTVRLGSLWAGMSFGSNLIVNSMLLNWLIRFTESQNYAIPSASASPLDPQPVVNETLE
ncbi:MAG: hypothetical protein L7S56_05935 [Candidatus Poseidonia sp.]|nr:hypothetical protein [Poseidonia sp.]